MSPPDALPGPPTLPPADAPPRFVHLRTHTEYSVVDSTLRIADLVDAVAADGQPAVAVTDLANLFGAVKFHNAARARGVQPLIGAEVWLTPDGPERPPTRLLLLAQNAQGYRHLCELLGAAWTGELHRGLTPCLGLDALAARAEGLIALAGFDLGVVGQALMQGDPRRAEAWARRLADAYPGRFVLELQRAGRPQDEPLVRATLALAARLDLPVVATHPVQFLGPEDFEAHEARVCIAEGETLADPRRPRRFSREQGFQTAAAMQARFADLPQALANSLAIARRCSLRLSLGKPQLPDFPTPRRPGPDGQPVPVPMPEHFREVAQAGLEERLRQRFPDAAAREAARPRYQERLDFEIGVILKMGFPGYFLIVADFINWAKGHGCPVGPGRGSGAGSLVAYALKITDLDPLAYQLLFERFLNPERVSMPDFDIDFCQENRDRVIAYVRERYGREAVGQIATFGTMAAKAALRDVGRVLGMGYGHVDSIAKLVPAPPGKTVTLAHPGDRPDPGLIYARVEAPEIGQREAQEEEVAELLALAERVEGLVRNVGMHAGGVLIAPGKITDFCPTYQQPGSEAGAGVVSQYDKDDVEAIGLVKFDFLGLATLTILEKAAAHLRRRHPARAGFRFEDLALDDRATYRLLSEGKTVAVFQLESRGMQGMLREAKPSVFEDIIALVALYRPGPMDLIPSFCARKHGREPVEYPHPLMRGVLEETYGIMVYQEQVMQVAQTVGGYSLGGADLLRRAMGKKKPEEMAKHRVTFAEGAARQGIEPGLANEIFDLMEKFAGYGFNKSHAAAYALLAYHTAWAKAHHPAEFFAANMTVSGDDTDKLKVFHDDAVAQFGLVFEPPDINTGTLEFEPIDPPDAADPGRPPRTEGERGRIRYALGAVKGVGQGAVEAIVAAREAGGPFTSFIDFCRRVDRQKVNKRAVEALVKAGAFDRLEAHRAALLASVGLGFEDAEAQARHADQGGLFDFGDEAQHGSARQEPPLVPAAPWSVRERLGHEKTALGFYLSGHLFDEHAEELRRVARVRLAELVDSREPQLLAGIVTGLRFVHGQRGRVALFGLDDGSDTVEAVVGEELLDGARERLAEDALVLVQARVQPDRFSGGLRLNVQQLWDLAEARCRFGRHLRLGLGPAGLSVLPALQRLARDFPPRRLETPEGALTLGLRLQLRLQRPWGEVELELPEDLRVLPSDEALAHCRTLAPEGASLVYETG